MHVVINWVTNTNQRGAQSQNVAAVNIDEPPAGNFPKFLRQYIYDALQFICRNEEYHSNDGYIWTDIHVCMHIYIFTYVCICMT